MSDLLIDGILFMMYLALLVKQGFIWRRMSTRCRMSGTCRSNLLFAILALLTLCTLTFMAANAYVLAAFEKTLLSIRVFQMFVVSNCLAYWLVLDLISAEE